MKDHPLVSIVISCYNDPDVVTAVNSAGNQLWANKEIILVDDGSNEETKKVISTVKDKIDILLIQENGGQSIARNNGIKKANGEYILNLDSDDYFEPDFVNKALEKFAENEEIKIVTCKAKRFNKIGQIDIFIPTGGYLKNFLFSNAALGSSMFRKCDWERVGGYEENLPILGFEDWEFYIHILKNGGCAFVIPEVLFNYQIRKGSTTYRIKNLRNDKFEYIVLKHKEIYKENFEDLVRNFTYKIKAVDESRIKIIDSRDFRLGSFF